MNTEVKLHPEIIDPKSSGVRHDEARGFIDIYWGNYEYSIDLKRIGNPLSLLQWVMHLSDKQWDGMTPYRIHEFIRKVCLIKGWNAYGSN